MIKLIRGMKKGKMMPRHVLISSRNDVTMFVEAIDGTLMKSSVLGSPLYCRFNLNEGDLKRRL